MLWKTASFEVPAPDARRGRPRAGGVLLYFTRESQGGRQVAGMSPDSHFANKLIVKSYGVKNICLNYITAVWNML